MRRKSGRDVDKFSAMHLTPSPAAKVGTVLVEESPVNLECKVTQVIPLGSHDLFWLKSLPWMWTSACWTKAASSA